MDNVARWYGKQIGIKGISAANLLVGTTDATRWSSAIVNGQGESGRSRIFCRWTIPSQERSPGFHSARLMDIMHGDNHRCALPAFADCSGHHWPLPWPIKNKCSRFLSSSDPPLSSTSNHQSCLPCKMKSFIVLICIGNWKQWKHWTEPHYLF